MRLEKILNELDKVYEAEVLEEAAIKDDIEKSKQKISKLNQHLLLLYIFRDHTAINHWCDETSNFITDSLYQIRKLFNGMNSSFKRSKIEDNLKSKIYYIDNFEKEYKNEIKYIENKKSMKIAQNISCNNYESFYNDFIDSIIEYINKMQYNRLINNPSISSNDIFDIISKLWNRHKI